MRELLVGYIGKQIIIDMGLYTVRGIIVGGDRDFVKIRERKRPGFTYVNLTKIDTFRLLEPEESPSQSDSPPDSPPD